MSPQEKLYKPEYAKELLQIAKGDLLTARALLKVDEGRRENIAFHLNELNEFATVRRYEEGKSELTKTDVAKLVDLATRVLEWADKS